MSGCVCTAASACGERLRLARRVDTILVCPVGAASIKTGRVAVYRPRPVFIDAADYARRLRAPQAPVQPRPRQLHHRRNHANASSSSAYRIKLERGARNSSPYPDSPGSQPCLAPRPISRRRRPSSPHLPPAASPSASQAAAVASAHGSGGEAEGGGGTG